MRALVITVSVAVLMAGVPSATADVAIAKLDSGFTRHCMKTHTGGCSNHRKINISGKRKVDSVSRCLEECTQVEECEGFSFGKANTPVDRFCVLWSGECQKDRNQRWEYYSTRDCIEVPPVDPCAGFGCEHGDVCELIDGIPKCVALNTVDCVWGDWENGKCSQTCGEGTRVDVRHRKRTAVNGGQECEGPSTRTENCKKLKECPVHCVWGKWWQLDECSKTCGVGTQVMRRTKLVKAAHGGKECDGADTKRELCNTVLCPESADPASKKTKAEMFLEECLTKCGQDLKAKIRCKKPEETGCLDQYTEMVPIEKE